MAVGNRKDQQLIDAKELAELRERAQDGVDLRAALRSLNAKRYQMMEIIREGEKHPFGVPSHARGWLEFESDLGEALLTEQRRRGEAPF